MFQGYLKSLGCTRTAQVKAEARIGEAEALKDSGIRVIAATYNDLPAPSLRQSIFSSSSLSRLFFIAHKLNVLESMPKSLTSKQ